MSWQVDEAAERFLRALDDLDWEPFRASWASEPTVFFPFGDTPDRVSGQVAVRGCRRGDAYGHHGTEPDAAIPRSAVVLGRDAVISSNNGVERPRLTG
jgi:hypothetical protein